MNRALLAPSKLRSALKSLPKEERVMEGGREKDSGREQRGENQKQTDGERERLGMPVFAVLLGGFRRGFGLVQ